jgi:hypothetical protein
MTRYKKSSMQNRYWLQTMYSIMIAAVVMSLGGSASAQSVPAAPASAAAAGQAMAPSTPVPVGGNISSDSMKPRIVEDFSTPSLEGSDLKTWDVISGDANTIDNAYIQEVTRVQWRPGDPVDLYIVKPVGVKNPPVILYLYSYPFETDRFLNHDFCKFLVKNGYAAVAFASALTGPRYHDVALKQWFVSELRESLATSAHDVQMILNYLATRGDVDMNRVGMFGDGSGASIAILAAAVDSRIKTLDLLDPWGDWPDWIAKSTRIPERERPDYLKPDWLAAVAPLDPVKWLPKLKTQKIRIQFVRDVGITPADVQQKIEAAVPARAKIVHYDNAAAFRTAIAGGTGFDWIKQNTQFGVEPGYSAAGQGQQKGPSNRRKDAQR